MNTAPTTPTPPQGLTDEQLLEMARYQLGFEGPIVLDEYEKLGAVVEFEVPQLLAFARAAISSHEANHLRDATKMALTPEEVEARFRAWWAESYPNAPVGSHAVRLHVDFALYLMGGEVGQ